MKEDPPDPRNSSLARKDDAISNENAAVRLERILLNISGEMLSLLENELGSRDAAHEALQDTSEKLARRPVLGEVRNPRAYLWRMALNFGRNRRKAAARIVSVRQAWLDEIPDIAPDPERIAAARRELAIIVEALADLTEQRRAIFLDKFRDDLSLDDIARLRGLHRRTVQKELTRVVELLRIRLGRPR
ncbi:RNA polymerase sigma factor [Novosphingobium sp. KA1]|uniref:RNA polymerase sigma factor n=1 Tax=Novosphingobium sp. (strain KA1) TaxID=164608 RepID=UPI001A8F2351|nr:sigma-70 family RNA polymerase sigma factor [Novosphingobium sp. KA1]QSR19676.1 hypothetical protein CA833_21255 [Novosphingobium sp. KA1]